MNVFFPKRAKDIKGKVAVAELRRAHAIIATLAVAFAVMIGLATTYQVQLNMALGSIAMVLLLVVAAISAATAYLLRRP